MGQHEFPFTTKDSLTVGDKTYQYHRLQALEEQGIGKVSRLPFSIKVLLEAALRQWDGHTVTTDHVKQLANWNAKSPVKKEVPFKPARIVLQDFTGVPAVVDLAALRSAMKRMGGDANEINPLVPVDLVIDHSVQVDRYASKDALEFNMNREFERNEERYRLLKWAEKAFENFRVVPPATGIVHQVNLEYLANVVQTKKIGDETYLFPDSLVGTDSHTTMINGIGVVGWGVGGIEAEAGMLGQPLYMLEPEVIGFKLTGKLAEGATATDLALTVTHMLREKGVVGKFVEFYGPGLGTISVADRATVANMSPEYGATMGFFPVDDETLKYLRMTARDEELIERVEAYLKAQGLFRTSDTPDPEYTDTLELDLSTVTTSLAGPKRPQDRIELDHMKEQFQKVIQTPVTEGGLEDDLDRKVSFELDSETKTEMGTGSLAIAAITSCTNTSNPSVMVGAGLVAKKAIERGLQTPPYVKTSLAPGSKVVTQYLEKAGLMPDLEALGFNLVGYGCTTCIGNSGPLKPEIEKAIEDNNLTVASVLSGNRNFEGRIHPLVKANYLASPPLVIAYALAGTVNIDLRNEPLGYDHDNHPVYLHDIWPSSKEVEETIAQAVTPEMFKQEYARVFDDNERWNAMEAPEGTLYDWDENSTYIQEPPFFQNLSRQPDDIEQINGANILALLGDSVTTDHISPAGAIAKTSPAGQYLLEHGVERRNFNSYGSRRGNHEVMMRGTFANIRIRNEMAPGTEGGVTRYVPTGEEMSIYDAAMQYQDKQKPLVIFAGKEYGTGSSRDWAAKGTNLLGVKAVIAESFERIHRSNLVGMGVLPLQFADGQSWKSLNIKGDETFEIQGLDNHLKPQQSFTVAATRPDGSTFQFDVVARLDSHIDIDYYRNSGILQFVLRNFLTA